jgi:dihydrofolate reductase
MAAKIILIAAVSENFALGKDNDLLWDIPEDLRQFQIKTHGHVIIMGRKTFESIGKPLKNRINIIITSDEKYQCPGIYVANSVESAIKIAKKLEKEDKIFVIGGGEIYKQMIDLADKIFLTIVHKNYPKADTFFPKINSKKWKEIERSDEKKSKNGLKYTFVNYDKI